MASLLAIPLELREHIIELVLQAEREPPTDPKIEESNRAPGIPHTARMNGWGYSRHEKQFPPPNGVGLLQANRQLHVETETALKRLFPDGIIYKLDIAYINEVELWPTWVHVPVCTRHVSALDITIRCYPMHPEYIEQYKQRFRHGTWGTFGYRSMWYQILNPFLVYGLRPPLDALDLLMELKLSQDCQITIETVDINLVPVDLRGKLSTPDGAELLAIRREAREAREEWLGSLFPWETYWRRLPSTPYAPINLNTLLGGLLGTLERHFLFLDGIGSPGRFEQLFYEQIGKIILSVRRNTRVEIDLSERLERLGVFYGLGRPALARKWLGRVPQEAHLLFFWNWKCRILQRRRELGFECAHLEDVSWPSLDTVRQWKVIGSRFIEPIRREAPLPLRHRPLARQELAFIGQDTSLEEMLMSIARAEEEMGRELA